MTMSQNVQCEQCGGADFRLESGFYFCTECQLQSQDIREHVLDDFYGGSALVTRKIKKTDDDKKFGAQQGPSGENTNLSSVELLNYVLKGLVDELIALGVPKKLKIITLQLWATYLRKNEIAFTSTTVPKKPKFGMWHRHGDVTRFYKVRKPVSVRDYPYLVKKKRKAVSKKSGTSRASSGESYTSRSKKLRLSASKTSLARAEYDESGMEGSINLSQASLSLHLSHGSQSCASSGEERTLYSKQGKKEINRYLEEIGKQSNKMKYHARAWRSHKTSMLYLRTELLVAILRIALILCGSDVHPGDLFRWSDEGYFSYNCMKKLVPSHVKLTIDQCQLFRAPPMNTTHIDRITAHMVIYLGVTNAGFRPSKMINTLVQRYCETLNLPGIISSGIEKLLKLKPPKVWLNCGSCNYEGRAMGLILFSLKILIGLDDITEYTYVPRRDVVGVKWEEWCRQYEARMAEKAVHHFPTLRREYPDSYVGRNHSFLSHWDPVYAPQKNYWKKAELSMCDSFQRALKPLICKLPEPSWRPGLERKSGSSKPPLAVLSESIDGSVRRGARNIILEPKPKNIKLKVKPKNAVDLKVRVLDDDAEVEIKSAQKTNKSSSARLKNNTENEDFSIWINHSTQDFSSPYRFVRSAGSKLPHSFWWLLNQMAHVVYQQPLAVYKELVKIERVYHMDRGTRKKGIW